MDEQVHCLPYPRFECWLQPFAGVSVISYKLRRIGYDRQVNDDNGPLYYATARVNTSEDNTIFMHWNGGASISFLLPNEDLLGISLSTNLAMDGKSFKTTLGEYEFWDKQGALMGRSFVDTRGHHIVLDIGCTFSRTREMKRGLERNSSGSERRNTARQLSFATISFLVSIAKMGPPQ